MLQSKFIFYILYLSIFLRLCSSNNNTLLIIISFDGFRYDYLNRNLTHTLVNLRRNSSHAPYMTSVFPSKTFPNHFSIATGLYTEVHGVLDNQVYDKISNTSLGYGYELFHYNDNVVPLWILNEKGGGGRRSGCMMWPGSNFKYQDILPSYYMKYNASLDWQYRVDTVMKWFQDPIKPINLAMMYFEQPDVTCHQHGPDSAEVNREIDRVDYTVRYLLEKAADSNLLSRLNIVLLSDHGGQSVKVPENIIDLDHFLDRTWYLRDGVAPNLQIYPVKGKEDEVLEALRGARHRTGGNFSTYTHKEMPDHWHYKNCRRAPPIFISADLGYLFTTGSNWSYSSGDTSVVGSHGWDPMETTMHAFFMAVGPLFKKDYIVKPFTNIHIYPMAAYILGLELPPLRPNGSLAQLKDILAVNFTDDDDDEDHTIYLVAGLFIVSICILGLLSWFIVRRKRQQRARMLPSTASYMSTRSTAQVSTNEQGA